MFLPAITRSAVVEMKLSAPHLQFCMFLQAYVQKTTVAVNFTFDSHGHPIIGKRRDRERRGAAAPSGSNELEAKREATRSERDLRIASRPLPRRLSLVSGSKQRARPTAKMSEPQPRPTAASVSTHPRASPYPFTRDGAGKQVAPRREQS